MDSSYFDIWPKVVRADRETTITIKPLFRHSEFKSGEQLKVRYVRDDGNVDGGGCEPWVAFTEIPFEQDGGMLRIKHFFAGENEHTFRLVAVDQEQKEKLIANLHVFSLKADLFELRPFKGDFHLHSFCSDGLESPAYVAASTRKVGMDFMALTDHHRYEPSLEAIAAMEKLPTDLRCYPGEEVHCPNSPVHVVNFGGAFSLNNIFRNDEERFRTETSVYEEKLSSDIHPSLRYQIAAAEWSFDQIRSGGGVSIYCHPYWRPEERYYVHSKVNDTIIDRQRFDALEVIGGFYRHQMESNALAVAHYQEARAKGQKIPVVGVSDSHGCDRDLFGWYYTVVLAHSVEFKDIAEGISSLNSVAVEAVEGEFPRVVGPFRQVRYIYFLLREYFPLHDKLCREEGGALLDVLSGDTTAEKRLAGLKGRVPALLDKYWG